VLALTVTVPVGAVTFVDPVTLQWTVAGLFGRTGFGEMDGMVVVVVALLTVNCTVAEAVV
jgi:hypothetical protein